MSTTTTGTQTLTAGQRPRPSRARTISFKDQQPPSAQESEGEESETKAKVKAKGKWLRKQLLRRWSELSEDNWQRKEGKQILTGYRAKTPTLSECFGSLFYLHNETVNIYTHLGGALLFVILSFALYEDLTTRYSTWTRGDITALLTFMFGVATCFTLSAGFHTFTSHSYEGYNLARRLDFQGIVILVLATSAPQTFYTFHGDLGWAVRHWTVIFIFGVLGSIATFLPVFEKPQHHSSRVAVFAGLGLSTFAPILHGCFMHGIEEQNKRFPLWAVAMTHSFNIFGAVVYTLHFPERWWPGTFDIFGASHQLMHAAIVGAALSLLLGSIIAFDNTHGTTNSWF